MASTDYIADVISEVLYGESAKAGESAEQSGAASGVFWVIGAVIVIAVLLNERGNKGSGRLILRNAALARQKQAVKS